MDKLNRLGILFWVFFSISSVALGGGLTMLPPMSREFVEKRSWMTAADMVDTVAIMQSMPGIISINMAVLIGYRISGVIGAFASVLGVVAPPFIVILAIAVAMKTLDSSKTLNHIFLGVRSAVSALILLSAIRLSKQIVKNTFTAVLAAAGFTAMAFFNVNAICLIIAGAALGLAYAYVPLLVKAKGERR